MKLLNEASAVSSWQLLLESDFFCCLQKSKVSKADGDKLIQQLIENKWLKYARLESAATDDRCFLGTTMTA